MGDEVMVTDREGSIITRNMVDDRDRYNIIAILLRRRLPPHVVTPRRKRENNVVIRVYTKKPSPTALLVHVSVMPDIFSISATISELRSVTQAAQVAAKWADRGPRP